MTTRTTPHRNRVGCGARAAMLLSLTGAALGLFAANAEAVRTRFSDWTPIFHPKRGFAIAYPADVFQPAKSGDSDDGQVLVSRDGKAKLLVGAFENSHGFTLHGYRDYLLKENYTNAKIDYEASRGKWFVISGTRGETMFYERVSFTCGGQIVNSWVMLYPIAERAFYDRVVEGIARTYLPGAGKTGNCD